MTPIRTLLVDDSLPFLKYLGLLLSRLPQLCVVGSATTMTEAFALAKSYRPDLILIDLSLQEGRSAEIISELKSDRPEICVLFMSGFEMVEYRDLARRCGADGFISKSNLHADLMPLVDFIVLSMNRTAN